MKYKFDMLLQRLQSSTALGITLQNAESEFINACEDILVELEGAHSNDLNYIQVRFVAFFWLAFLKSLVAARCH
jgi:hypothetical protein